MMFFEQEGLAENLTESLPDCNGNPIGSIKRMFVDLVMGRREARGQSPVLRPVFLKPHGVALARFEVAPHVPDNLRVGLFAEARSYDAVVRFSSDTTPRNPDQGTTVGLAFKVIGVPGAKLLHPDASTCDFLLQNHDVFFVDTAQDMCEFTRAGVVGGDYEPYLEAHPLTRQILKDMGKPVTSSLDQTYWGILPHRLGQDQHVKYKLTPSASVSAAGAGAGPNYLYADLKARLAQSEARFEVFIQVGRDENSTPLDRATVRWEEEVATPIHVATLVILVQNIDAPNQAALGENLSFSIWQTLPEHEPVGSLAMARRDAYQAAAERRGSANRVSQKEPEQLPLPQPANFDTTVVRAEIHPAIGVARVGNSQNEWFYGPEVPSPALSDETYRDAAGALKRQAARFRLYGYNSAGQVVGELTVDNAVIEWSVHVANKKSAWYAFNLAMDIDEVADPRVPPAVRRNSGVKGSNRKKLVIDPGPRSIHGRLTQGSTYRFDSGLFFDEPVYLGELRTDDEGRLIFLGGRGVSRTPSQTAPYDFANNDDWCDDISDGPVTATVRIGEQEIPVERAWVVVGPPNYAPELKSVRTMYDLVADKFKVGASDRVSFQHHVLPIFERLAALQWVNGGFASQFGWRGPYDFLDPDLLKRLSADPGLEANYPRNQLRMYCLAEN